MELSIKDRLVLLQALAGATGNLTEARILRELRQDLDFTEEEHKGIGFKTEGNAVRWEPKANFAKEIPIGDVAHRLIVKRFKELDLNRQITDEILDTIDKFPEVENA